MSEKKWSTPQPVDRATMAFGCGKDFDKLLPPYNEIPEEFRRYAPNAKWQKFMSDWFFGGLKNFKPVMKAGVDQNTAMRHLRAIIGSFEPKHEHKEAAVAWLASLWFDDATTWEHGK